MMLWVADFQPNKAAPLSSVAVAAGGDIFTPNGKSQPHSTPQALDKAGIAKAGTFYPQSLPVQHSQCQKCKNPKSCHVGLVQMEA